MNKITISTTLEVYDGISELPLAIQNLMNTAIEARNNAYAPYSKFNVGTALLLDNNEVIIGSNQENASYPLCLCAERVALAAAAVVYPNVVIHTMAVTVKHPDKVIDKPAMPCGACRQVICEVEQKQQHPIRIITHGETGEVHVFKSGLAILPLAFDATYL